MRDKVLKDCCGNILECTRGFVCYESRIVLAMAERFCSSSCVYLNEENRYCCTYEYDIIKYFGGCSEYIIKFFEWNANADER